MGRSCRLPAGECLGLAVPPNTHSRQPLLSGACPPASRHAGPRLPWGVLPERVSFWQGGLGGQEGEGQDPPSTSHLPAPQDEDTRLEARATLNSQCGLKQVVVLSRLPPCCPPSVGAQQGVVCGGMWPQGGTRASRSQGNEASGGGWAELELELNLGGWGTDTCVLVRPLPTL